MIPPTIKPGNRFGRVFRRQKRRSACRNTPFRGPATNTVAAGRAFHPGGTCQGGCRGAWAGQVRSVSTSFSYFFTSPSHATPPGTPADSQ